MHSHDPSLEEGAGFDACCPEFNHPKAEAPPIGFADFGLIADGGAIGLLSRPAVLAGAASNPTGGWVEETDEEVFSLAGLSIFIPRPRPARWYPELLLASLDASVWPFCIESRLQEPQMLPASGFVGAFSVPFSIEVRLSSGLVLC